jgi:hypothetical protein
MLLGTYYDGVEMHREEKIVYARFLTPHRVISTCQVAGGLRDDLGYLYNHQSSEPAGHHPPAYSLAVRDPLAYREQVCRSHHLGRPPWHAPYDTRDKRPFIRRVAFTARSNAQWRPPHLQHTIRSSNRPYSTEHNTMLFSETSPHVDIRPTSQTPLQNFSIPCIPKLATMPPRRRPLGTVPKARSTR